MARIYPEFPTIFTLIQIFFSAVEKHEALALPVAAVLMAIDLTVHPQVAVGQSGLFSSTLVGFWPVYDSGERVSPEMIYQNYYSILKVMAQIWPVYDSG